MAEFIAGVIVGVLLFLVGRLRSVPSNEAEAKVSNTIRHHLQGEDYHLIDNITLPVNGSTTQIDHILVSRYGVFVIETKGYKGWIYGNERDRQWTQVLYKSKHRFGNPVRQNAGHLSAVRGLFNLKPDIFYSVVVFCGDLKFKSDMPPNVMHFTDIILYIKSHQVEVLSHSQMVYVIGKIETARLCRSREVDEYHRNNIAKKLERRANL